MCADGTHAAWHVIEGMGNVAGAVGSVTALPTKAVSSWMGDIVAPTCWRPNSEIVVHMSIHNVCIHHTYLGCVCRCLKTSILATGHGGSRMPSLQDRLLQQGGQEPQINNYTAH